MLPIPSNVLSGLLSGKRPLQAVPAQPRQRPAPVGSSASPVRASSSPKKKSFLPDLMGTVLSEFRGEQAHSSHVGQAQRIKQAEEAVRHALLRPSIFDPYRLTVQGVEDLIDSLVALHKMGHCSQDLAMLALATAACVHSRKQGPPRHLRNSVRWLQRQELGSSIALLPSSLPPLAHRLSTTRLLWASSLMVVPATPPSAPDLDGEATSLAAAASGAPPPGTGQPLWPAAEEGAQAHAWAGHEITYAACKMSAPVMVAGLNAELGQGAAGLGTDITDTAAALLGVTSPKLVGIGFLADACVRLGQARHEPCSLIGSLRLCMQTSMDEQLSLLLDREDQLKEQEVLELQKILELVVA